VLALVGVLVSFPAVSWSQEIEALEEVAEGKHLRLQLSDETEWRGVLRGSERDALYVEIEGQQLVRIDTSDLDSLEMSRGEPAAQGSPSAGGDGSRFSSSHVDEESTLAHVLTESEIEDAVTRYERGQRMRNVGTAMFVLAGVASLATVVASATEVSFYEDDCMEGACNDSSDFSIIASAAAVGAGSLITGTVLTVAGNKKMARHRALLNAARAVEQGASSEPEVQREAERGVQFAVLPGIRGDGGGANILLQF
jgi:hypothetical protein